MLYENIFTRIFIFSLLLGCVNVHASPDMNYHIQYKPHAPIDMTFEIENENIEINQSIKIKLIFKNRIDVDDLIINLQTNSDLQLLGDKQQNFGMQPVNQSNIMNINAIIKKQGIVYINVLVTMLNDNQQQSRSFAVPVNVKSTDGLQATNLNRNINEIKAINGIISMPAIKR